MQDGRFPIEVVNGVPVAAAPEEIDITNAPALRSALLEAAAHGHGILMADMTRTQFCDSSGLHTLLAAHKRAQAEGGELLLAIAAAPVLRVLAITSIDRMIPNFTTLDEALTQTSADGPNGHRRADGAPEGSQENKLVAQYAISELDEKKPMAVASASLEIPDRAVPGGAPSCAFSARGLSRVRG